ncbi:Phosphoribosylglycinamide formyltransferase [compost metagenome]
MDEGPILAQAAVPIVDGDTEDSLAARVLKAEHKIYALALTKFVSGNTETDLSQDAMVISA